MLPLFAACTADYSPAPPAGDLLPPDTYPLQIASLTIAADGQPGTRLADNGNATSWQPGDQVMVSLGDRQAIYTYNADTDTWQSDTPLYWQSKEPQTVNAWYPVTDEIDFTQQNEGLTYLLKADPVSATYGQEESVNLTFHHQLAKVRVVLEGAKAQDVAAVTVRSYPKSVNDKGALGDRTGGDPIYVPMLQTTYEGQPCWEATLRDGTLQADDSFKVAAEGGTPMQVVLDKNISIKAGEVYTININVEQAPTEINLDTYEGPTLAVRGKTILKGDGQQKNLQITVEADAEVTLENVVLAPSATGNAITCKGDATIILTGSSSLTAKSYYTNDYYHSSGIYVERGTLTIDGDGSLNISRAYASISSMSVGAGIGAGSGGNIVIESGNISIGDVPDGGSMSGAGIGSTPEENCGNITIKGGIIHIGKPSWYSACIGSATYTSCGDITISGESTVITFTQGDYAPWGIGNGDSGTCGTVTVGDGATVNGVKYTETHTGPL